MWLCYNIIIAALLGEFCLISKLSISLKNFHPSTRVKGGGVE